MSHDDWKSYAVTIITPTAIASEEMESCTAAASPEEMASRKDKKHGLMIERLVMKLESDYRDKIIVYSEKLNAMTDEEIEKEYRMVFGDQTHETC